jgi:hypothetical protein
MEATFIAFLNFHELDDLGFKGSRAGYPVTKKRTVDENRAFIEEAVRIAFMVRIDRKGSKKSKMVINVIEVDSYQKTEASY